MSDISYLSQAQKTVLQSSHELMTLINRVTTLQQEQKKIQQKNDITQKQVNKILQVKQTNADDKEKIRKHQSIRQNALEQKQKKIQTLRNETTLQKDELYKAIKQMRNQEYIAIKQQSLIAELKLKEARDQELEKRKEQAAQIQGWRNNQKQQVLNYWENRVNYYKDEKNQQKESLMEQAQLQQTAIEQLEKIELDLISKLKQSQLINKQLNDQLIQVLHLPHEEYQSLYPQSQEQSQQSDLLKKAYKTALKSPYAVIPAIHRSTRNFKASENESQTETGSQIPPKKENNELPDSKNQNQRYNTRTLPYLYRQSYKEQQQTIKRLYHSKKSQHEDLEIIRKQQIEQQSNKKNDQFKKISNNFHQSPKANNEKKIPKYKGKLSHSHHEKSELSNINQLTIENSNNHQIKAEEYSDDYQEEFDKQGEENHDQQEKKLNSQSPQQELEDDYQNEYEQEEKNEEEEEDIEIQ